MTPPPRTPPAPGGRQNLFRFLPRLGLFLLLLSAFAPQPSPAQVAVSAPSPSPQAAARPKGTIAGRVVGEDGQPLANARVFASSRMSARRQRAPAAAVSGIDGKFTLQDLERGAYSLTAHVPGYFDAVELELDRGERRYYRTGETVELRMIKGGVITGRVTNADGEPVIATRVNAVRIRDLEGRPIRELTSFSRSLERTTDDRGVYRMHSLLPGVYLVSAGGRMSWGWSEVSRYDGDAPTYHPSATRDATTEVIVRAGQEAADIDIRYRGEAGHAVSGTLEGAGKAAAKEGPAFLNITTAATTGYEGTAYFSGNDGRESFSFDGLGDGDYDLIAERRSTDGDLIAAATQRVSVRGADVTGLKLSLKPLASLTGQLVIEPPLAAAQQTLCPQAEPASPEEIVVLARRGGAAARTGREIGRPGGDHSTSEAVPDDKGAFALRGLDAASYRLKVQLPREQLYLRSIKLANLLAAPARDPVLHGVTLRPGEQAAGLTITVAHGAAFVGGRVVVTAAVGSESQTLDAARVHLIPAEREREDDLLSYAETQVRADSSFVFTNLAPGRYWLHPTAAPPAETPETEDTARPLAWDTQARAGLRRAAEAGKVLIELKPCQRIEDFKLQAPQP